MVAVKRPRVGNSTAPGKAKGLTAKAVTNQKRAGKATKDSAPKGAIKAPEKSSGSREKKGEPTPKKEGRKAFLESKYG